MFFDCKYNCRVIYYRSLEALLTGLNIPVSNGKESKERPRNSCSRFLGSQFQKDELKDMLMFVLGGHVEIADNQSFFRFSWVCCHGQKNFKHQQFCFRMDCFQFYCPVIFCKYLFCCALQYVLFSICVVA